MSRTVTREVLYYNIDMIISIVYRVNFIKGTQFRIWANKIQKDVSEKTLPFQRLIWIPKN